MNILNTPKLYNWSLTSIQTEILNNHNKIDYNLFRMSRKPVFYKQKLGLQLFHKNQSNKVKSQLN